ncbi:549_t:CDS:2, partial [Cetraspora pellucida]
KLILLLSPFAQLTKLIGGLQYPTLTRTEMDQFYNGEVSNPVVYDELERYKKVTQMN